ncbi:leucine-rich PPR motif-containing protein, mitochondrial isoform X2 [Topomyia yanbarensis]|uniref:leucine-rich PPR motif-containing protein, mitochondrial isoform X2 n=1 Tax=Topomyia yanbarensis TaxID=2498891 RepID=UPI00273C19B0|nr:leucine-rich PPR motif-containing protein, mitochondrial isoform X2 [Topomyia yanbarensis]
MNILRNTILRQRAPHSASAIALKVSSQPTNPYRYTCNLHVRSCTRPLTVAASNRNQVEIRSPMAQTRPGFQREKTTTTLLDEMGAEARVHRRVQLEKLNRVLAKPEVISGVSYEFLLGCCGRLLMEQPVEARMKLFKSIWFMAGEPSTTTAALNRWKVLLRVHCENGIDLEEQHIEEFLGKVKVAKDEEFYQLLLGVVSERGDIRRMQEVMDIAQREGYKFNSEFGRVLIRGYCKAKDLPSVKAVLDRLIAENIYLNSGIYGELIVGYLANKKIADALELINDKGKLLKKDHVVEAIKEALLGDHNEVLGLLVKLLPATMRDNAILDPVLRNLCSDLMNLKKFDAIHTLLGALPIPRFGEAESYDTYGSAVIFEMIKTRVPLEEVTSLVEFLIKTGRNTRALHVACDCAAKNRIDIYPHLLGQLREQEDLRPHYFWPLIIHNFTKQGEAGVLSVLKLMQRFGTELDAETLSVFVLPKLSITLNDVRGALKQFEDRGIKMATLMTPLVSHLLHQIRFDDVSKIVKLYSSKLDTTVLIWPLTLQAMVSKNSEHFRKVAVVVRDLMTKARDPKHDLAGQLLLELISNKKAKHNINSIKSLLKQYKNADVKISSISANVLKKYNQEDSELEDLLKTLVYDKLTLPSKDLLSQTIVHPRDMGYEELECHLSELVEKGMNARGVLRRLLQLCVRENRLDRAVEIKRRCDEANVDLSSGMMASIFDLHIKLKNVDEAGKALEKIRSTFPSFLIDDHKIIDFAALLIENGFSANAQKVLRQRAAAGPIRVGNANKNIWNLLNITAQKAVNADPHSQKNQTHELLQFLVKQGYCTYDNAILGPVIREYLLKNQTLSAITEFMQMAKEHRRTPLQLEIITTLVRLTNSNDPTIPPEKAKILLGEVIQAASAIHGPTNTNNTLLVALAEAGTEAQLRRMLINPETRVNLEYILTQCEYLIDSGKLDVVLRLAKCSRGLANVREADFLALIMKQYARDNNCEAAVNLFHRLQTEDGEMTISGDFARKLIDLLEVNSYEVPNAIWLYAK